MSTDISVLLLIYNEQAGHLELATNVLHVFFRAFQIVVIGFLTDHVVGVYQPRDEEDPAPLR